MYSESRLYLEDDFGGFLPQNKSMGKINICILCCAVFYCSWSPKNKTRTIKHCRVNGFTVYLKTKTLWKALILLFVFQLVTNITMEEMVMPITTIMKVIHMHITTIMLKLPGFYKTYRNVTSLGEKLFYDTHITEELRQIVGLWIGSPTSIGICMFFFIFLNVLLQYWINVKRQISLTKTIIYNIFENIFSVARIFSDLTSRHFHELCVTSKSMTNWNNEYFELTIN